MRVEVVHRRLSDRSEVFDVVVEDDYCRIEFNCGSFDQAKQLMDAIEQLSVDVSARVFD